MCYARVDGEWQPQNATGHTSARYVGAGGGMCTVDDHCWGAGICRERCICDPGFRGLRCQELDVLPASTEAAYESSTAATWGASVLPSSDNKSFHMWVSEMAGGCGLNSWEPKSQVRGLIPFERRSDYLWQPISNVDLCAFWMAGSARHSFNAYRALQAAASGASSVSS